MDIVPLCTGKLNRLCNFMFPYQDIICHKISVPIILQLAYLHQISTDTDAVADVKDGPSQPYATDMPMHQQKLDYSSVYNSKQQDNRMVIKRPLELKQLRTKEENDKEEKEKEERTKKRQDETDNNPQGT